MACNVIAERAGRLRNPSHLVPKPEFEQVGSFEDRRRRYSSKLARTATYAKSNQIAYRFTSRGLMRVYSLTQCIA